MLVGDLLHKRVVLTGVVAPADATAILALGQGFVASHGGVFVGASFQRRGVSRSSRPGGAAASRAARPMTSSIYIGTGKARVIAELCRSTGADVVLFVNPLSATQRSRLEAMLGLPVASSEELLQALRARDVATKGTA